MQYAIVNELRRAVCEDDAQRIEDRIADTAPANERAFACVVCGVNGVNPYDGEDTRSDCLGRMRP